jgi:branched-chain amino acid transport system ATP-binding protein
MSPVALEVTGLTVRYGTVTAVSDLSLQVAAGSLVGLIGPNGAGKTSAIDALTGFAPASGRVVLEGRDVTRMGASRRAQHGLGRTWQSLELFDDLSVQENIDVSRRSGMRGVEARQSRDAIEDPLSYLGLDDYRQALPRSLPLGVRKLVGVARALASHARVIAMDEPAAGLDSEESAQLGNKLRRLVDDGLAILLVDHDMNLVLEVCDDLYVIEFGKLIAHGAPDRIVHNPAVVRAYLGGSTADEVSLGEVADGDVA